MDLLSRSSLRTLVAVIVAAAATMTAPAALLPASASDSVRTCRDVQLSVGLSATAPQDLTLYGRYCKPAVRTTRVLQVLVHGGTYSHTYWDFPGFDGRYSYAQAMNRAGYPTLAVDLLGVGRSSHPSSLSVTIDAQAYAIHAVIAQARAGALGASFDRVLLVGHSLGTLTADVEIATYADVDGFIATGMSHAPGAVAFGRIFARARPALLDPVTSSQVPPGDLGYISIPDARPLFYAGGDVDPALQVADEASRSPGAAGYLATLGPYVAATPLLRTDVINVPILIANGSNDIVFCRQGGGGSNTDCQNSATLLAAEAPFYAPDANLEAFVLQSSGHNINLVPHAQTWYARALRWCQTFFPV